METLHGTIKYSISTMNDCVDPAEWSDEVLTF